MPYMTPIAQLPKSVIFVHRINPPSPFFWCPDAPFSMNCHDRRQCALSRITPQNRKRVHRNLTCRFEPLPRKSNVRRQNPAACHSHGPCLQNSPLDNMQSSNGYHHESFPKPSWTASFTFLSTSALTSALVPLTSMVITSVSSLAGSSSTSSWLWTMFAPM